VTALLKGRHPDRPTSSRREVGDPPAVEAASAAWYENADAIATALNGLAQKHWPLDEMKAT